MIYVKFFKLKSWKVDSTIVQKSCLNPLDNEQTSMASVQNHLKTPVWFLSTYYGKNLALKINTEGSRGFVLASDIGKIYEKNDNVENRVEPDWI
jgi:hypothetical protein